MWRLKRSVLVSNAKGQLHRDVRDFVAEATLRHREREDDWVVVDRFLADD